MPPSEADIREHYGQALERDDLKAFLLVLRQAFRLVNAWIERRYNLRVTE